MPIQPVIFRLPCAKHAWQAPQCSRAHGIRDATAILFVRRGPKVAFNSVLGAKAAALLEAAGGEAFFMQRNMTGLDRAELAVFKAPEGPGRRGT